MNSHSEDSRHHYGLLLEATSRWKEKSDVNLLSADGKVRLFHSLSYKSGLVHDVTFVWCPFCVLSISFRSFSSQTCGTLSPLVLAASSPLLRSCLEEGCDAILLPDISSPSLALLATCLLHPLSYLDTTHVALLEDLVHLLGITLPNLQPSPYIRIGQEEVEAKINNYESTIANTVDMIDDYSETDANGNPSTGDEDPISRNIDSNVNNDSWAPKNNPTKDTGDCKKENFNSLFCSLCHTPCYDTAAMEIHLAQHCEVQVCGDYCWITFLFFLKYF